MDIEDSKPESGPEVAGKLIRRAPIANAVSGNARIDNRNAKIYSAPRRFDLATIFVVMIVYSCMFGALEAIQVPPVGIVSIAIFFSAIGLAQATLHRGQRPRLSSITAGAISCPVLFFITMTNQKNSFLDLVSNYLVVGLIAGTIFGYLCGTLIGGVFLVADKLRLGRGVIEI